MAYSAPPSSLDAQSRESFSRGWVDDWFEEDGNSFDDILKEPEDAVDEIQAKTKKRALTAIIVWTVIVLLVLGGIVFIFLGLNHKEDNMNLPSQTYDVSNSDAVNHLGWFGEKEKIKAMPAPGVYIPAIDTTGAITPRSGFVNSKYRNFLTLNLPQDQTIAAWYSGGAPLYVSDLSKDTGSTLVAAHIGYSSRPGVFWNLYKMKVGEVVWTKDKDGNIQAWVGKKLYNTAHTAFDQSYFSKEGERRLILTTCGGRVNSYGYYRDNIFYVAVPLNITLEDVPD